MKTTIYFNPAPKVDGARNQVVVDKTFAELLHGAPAGFIRIKSGGITWYEPLTRVRKVVEGPDERPKLSSAAKLDSILKEIVAAVEAGDDGDVVSILIENGYLKDE